jgi:hypothetical protein
VNRPRVRRLQVATVSTRYYLEADDRVRGVGLFQPGDLLVAELHVDGGDRVVKVVLLRDAPDRAVTTGLASNHANATCAGKMPRSPTI